MTHAAQQAAEAVGRELQPIARLQPDTWRGSIPRGRSLAAIRWAARAMPDATRSSWKTLRETGLLDPVDYTDTFTQPEFEWIRSGLIPRAMEDKWFIFFEKPRLYLHRSWTGHLIFKVELADIPDGARVARAEVVRDDQTQIRESNEKAAKLLAWLIRGLLLRQDVAFPEL